MTLAFYKVDNSKGYERNTCDMLCDRPQVIKDMLSELKYDEVRYYDMDNNVDRSIFQDDYNEEVIDCYWWCVVIND
jgi:hypothetical protein